MTTRTTGSLKTIFEDFTKNGVEAVDSFFSKFAPEIYKEFGVAFNLNGFPKVDIYSDRTGINIIADLCGYNKENVSIKVDGSILRIEGSKREDYPELNTEKENPPRIILKEIKSSNFSRSFTLGENIDSDNINAKFINGYLKISIPNKVSAPETKKSIIIN